MVGGVGLNGHPFETSGVVVALGRDAIASSILRFGGELTIAQLPTEIFACAQATSATTCDVRDLEHFSALSVTGVLSAPTPIAQLYFRANIGVWLGHYENGTAEQSSRGAGVAIVREGGIRVGHVAAAIRLDQLNGALRGPLRMGSLVARVSF